MAKRKSTSKAERYRELAQKIAGMTFGGGNYWKPKAGRSSIRILPEVGSMDFFFVEVGRHYIKGGTKSHMCPKLCSDGELPCPICEVQQAFWDDGDKDSASNYRVSRQFWMNVIVRDHEDKGVQIYTPGVTVFEVLASYIGDVDFGDVTDIDEGFDFRIDKDGEGRDTKYKTRAARNPTELGSDEEATKWMDECEDLQEMVKKLIPSYDELIEQADMGAFFGMDDTDDDYDDEDDDYDPPFESGGKASPGTASAAIRRKMEQRSGETTRAPATRKRRRR